MAEELIKTLAESVTTFVDQTKENLLGVQTDIQQLKDTVDTMAKEMKADREAQKKSADAAGKKLNKTVAAIGGQVAEALATGEAVEAEVTSDAHLRPKEPPKLRTTDFGEQHTDWKHSKFNSVQFWNKDVAQLMTKKDLSFIKNDDNEDEFWLNPKLMSANEAGFRLLSTAVRKKARTHLTNAMNLAQSGPAIPTVQDKDSDDNRNMEYPEAESAAQAQKDTPKLGLLKSFVKRCTGLVNHCASSPSPTANHYFSTRFHKTDKATRQRQSKARPLRPVNLV